MADFSGGFQIVGQMYDHNGALKFHRDNGKVYDIASQNTNAWIITILNADPPSPFLGQVWLRGDL